MKHQSALGRVKGLGSARSGSRQWLRQKLSAVVLGVLFLWFAFSFARYMNASYSDVITWIGKPFNTVLLLTLIVTGFYHAIVGLQMIVEDYVSSTGRRLALLWAIKVILSMFGLAAVVAVLKIAVGV